MKPISTGSDAAKAIVTLMQSTFDTIQPLDIVNKYVELSKQGLKPKEIADGLWKEFGAATTSIMKDGSYYLAHIWQTAWDTGAKIARLSAKSLDQQDMIDLYTDSTFLPSHTIDTIGPLLSQSPASGANSNAAKPQSRPAKKVAAKKT